MHAYRLTAEVPESANEVQKLEDRMDIEAFRQAKVEVDKEGTVPLEQVKAELGL